VRQSTNATGNSQELPKASCAGQQVIAAKLQSAGKPNGLAQLHRNQRDSAACARRMSQTLFTQLDLTASSG